MVKTILILVYKRDYVRLTNMLMINIMIEFVYYNVLIRIVMIVSPKCSLTLLLKCVFINVQTIILAISYKVIVKKQYVSAHVLLL